MARFCAKRYLCLGTVDGYTEVGMQTKTSEAGVLARAIAGHCHEPRASLDASRALAKGARISTGLVTRTKRTADQAGRHPTPATWIVGQPRRVDLDHRVIRGNLSRYRLGRRTG